MNVEIVYNLADWTRSTIEELTEALWRSGVDYKFELNELIISKSDEDLVDGLIKQISGEGIVSDQEPRDVVYDLAGWSNAERIKFMDALNSAGVIHDYDGVEVAVGESLEAKVDEVLLTVHGVSPRLDYSKMSISTKSPLWKRVWFVVLVGPLAALMALGALFALLEAVGLYSPAVSTDQGTVAEVIADTVLETQTTANSEKTPQPVQTTTTTQPLPTTTINEVEASKTKYRTESRAITKKTISSLVTLERLFQNPDIYDQLWVLNVAGQLLTFRTAHDDALNLSVPANYQGAHNNLMSALSTLNKVSFDLPRAIDSLNTKEAGRQAQKMWGTLNALDRFTTATDK